MLIEKTDNKLARIVHDRELIDFFYLDLPVETLIKKIQRLEFRFISSKSDVPFNAQLRDYCGAIDSDGRLWIVKKIKQEEIFSFKLGELTYYLDFAVETLSAPTAVVKIEDSYYRSSKVVIRSTQISGYNYLEEPFKKVLANDLINRWLYFDEDRNPNNYLVIHNSKNIPLVIAIDFNYVDLTTKNMKITGNSKKFGWFRKEKTRFLTLLKPENFDIYSLNTFAHRFSLLMKLTREDLMAICLLTFKETVEDYKQKAELITENLLKRRDYIKDYFDIWFDGVKHSADYHSKNEEYSDFGKAFLDYHKKKK